MNQNKNIWLIDLGGEITWCDCPEPSNDIEPEDVTKYVREDVVIEKDSLLKEIFSDITKDNMLSPDTFDRLVGVVKNEL